MKINFNQPLLVKPNNLPIIEDGKQVMVATILEQSLRYTVKANNDDELKFYKKLMEMTLDTDLSKSFELSVEQASLLKKWVYGSNLSAFAVDFIISLINGDLK